MGQHGRTKLLIQHRHDSRSDQRKPVVVVHSADVLVQPSSKFKFANPATARVRSLSVIILIKDYEELLERVEDTDDVAWLKRARRKPLHYRPLEDYLAERNRK